MHVRLLGLMLMGSILACDRPGGQNTVTRHGEDVLASGSAPQVEDSVLGDVILAGGDLHFSGAAGGDYLGAGGSQTIGGRVHGAIRAIGGEIHMTASVDRNATIAGGDIEVDRAAVIGRNAYLAGGTVRIDGTVHEGLLVSGGTVVLNGTVDGDVEVMAGELHVGPTATIAGKLRYRVPKGEAHIDPAAHISGAVTALPAPTGRPVWYIIGIIWMFGFLVAGAVVVALIPRFMADAAELLRERPGRSALVGLGWIILLPIAIVVVACTIIGLPLALLTAVVYGTLMYIGRIAPAVWLGKRILGTRARVGRVGTLANFGIGGIVLLLIRIIPVLGPLVICVATVLGLGALLLRVRVLHEQQSM